MKKQWLFSKKLDLLFLNIPIWITWLICFIYDEQFSQLKIPLIVWVIFVLGIDVTHVWSTIFRTYLSEKERGLYQKSIRLAPILAFSIAFLLSWYSEYAFWRVLAYFALYHFIKQQYGFLKLYQVKEYKVSKFFKDEWVLYIGTLYPVLIWHFLGDRKFNWFVEGDFVIFPILNAEYLFLLNILYFFILIFWVLECLYIANKKNSNPPMGKILWVTSTFGTWWLGIVYFNSDFSFTITNVVAHGIPYMALVFYYVERKNTLLNPSVVGKSMLVNVVWMFIICLFLGYFEEFFWDIFINSERNDFYGNWTKFYLNNSFVRAIFIGVLAMPQITHYILDGVIWKGKDNPYLKKVFAE